LNQTDVDAGNFDNTATVKGTPPSGEDITSTGDFSQFLSDRPMIGVAKRVVSVTRVSPGTHDVTMEFRIKNYGNVTLHDINLTDDLTETFPLPTAFTVRSVSSTDTLLKLNPAFDGDTDINLLLAGNNLDVDQTRVVTLVVRVIPASRGPYTNTAWAYGTSPEDVIVNDQSQNGTDADPGPDPDDNPTNNNEVTPVDFGARIFDPPFGVKTVDSTGVPLLKWTMVWINNSNIVDVHAIVHDPIPATTTFEPGLVDSGFAVPADAPDDSTSLGVSCTSSTQTVTELCYYEGPTEENPLGQIIWEGTLGPDLGITEAMAARNAITISFNVKVIGSTLVSNKATIDSDLNGDGDANDINLVDPNLNERRVTEANYLWDVTPRGMPHTGFAPERITPLSEPEVKYTNLGDVWLKIPSMGIEIPIVGVPEVTNGWDVTWLGTDAGWLNGTAFPTFVGNSVITGHVYDASGNPGPFMNLTSLKYGDAVIVRAYGFTYTFEVREMLTVAPTDLKEALKHQEQPWITLVTCQGFNEETKSYSSRVLVRAVLVKVE
jgi:LPXTG-site transpeptidase (sortase) family protein